MLALWMVPRGALLRRDDRGASTLDTAAASDPGVAFRSSIPLGSRKVVL